MLKNDTTRFQRNNIHMPQFRLTAKMAKELKISNLGQPQETSLHYDDWYVHVVRIARKRVYIFMHITTRLAIALPNYEIGGIQNLFPSFALQLQRILKELDYDAYGNIADEACQFFEQPKDCLTFTKTAHKSTIRYIADFDYMLNFELEKRYMLDRSQCEITQEICDEISQYWLSYLIKDPLNPKGYIYPKDLVARILLPKTYH